MFYYYGRRKQIAHLYPAPRHNRIVEPFAGSAAYALHWAEQGHTADVLLIDLDETVAMVWRYLLAASERDILTLPSVSPGESLHDHRYLTAAEKALMGFHVNPGSAVPKLKVSPASRWEAGRRYIVKMLPRVRHWRFQHGSYESAPAETATWFIDPPFQVGGHHYRHALYDYGALARWVLARQGFVVVCEAEPADWLKFEPLGSVVNNGGLNKAKRRRDLVYQGDQA